MTPSCFGRLLIAFLIGGLATADSAPEEKAAPPAASPKRAEMIAIEAHFLRATDRQMHAAVKALSDSAEAAPAHVLAILRERAERK